MTVHLIFIFKMNIDINLYVKLCIQCVFIGIISYHIILYDIVSYHIMLYRILWYTIFYDIKIYYCYCMIYVESFMFSNVDTGMILSP